MLGIVIPVGVCLLLISMVVVMAIDERHKRNAEIQITVEAIKAGLQQKVVTRPTSVDGILGNVSYKTEVIWVKPGPDAMSHDMNVKINRPGNTQPES